jgi:hypothetical protein
METSVHMHLEINTYLGGSQSCCRRFKSSGTLWYVAGRMAPGASNDRRVFIVRVKQSKKTAWRWKRRVRFLRNVGIYSPNGDASHLGRLQSSITEIRWPLSVRPCISSKGEEEEQQQQEQEEEKWKVGKRNSPQCIHNRLELYFGWRRQEIPTEFWCWYSKYVYCHCVFLKDIK